MSSELHAAALRAVAAVAVLEALAAAENKLWPEDVRVLAGARGVAEGLARATGRAAARC